MLTVLRYVLLNPCRARLVQSPWEWRWSSLWFDSMLAPWPVEAPGGVRAWLETPLEDAAAEEVRASIRRGSPLGDSQWQVYAASGWGLESTLRPRGRPGAEAVVTAGEETQSSEK